LKLSKNGYRTSCAIAIKLNIQIATIAETLDEIYFMVSDIWNDVNFDTLHYINETGLKALHHAFVNDEQLRLFLEQAANANGKKVKHFLCLELKPKVIGIYLLIVFNLLKFF